MSDLAQITKEVNKPDIDGFVYNWTVFNLLEVGEGGTALLPFLDVTGDLYVGRNEQVNGNLTVGSSATVNNVYSIGDSFFDNNISVDGLINSQLSLGNAPTDGGIITLQGQAIRLNGYAAHASGIGGFTLSNDLIGTSRAILSSFESVDTNAYNIVIFTNVVSDGQLAVSVYNGYTSSITIDIMIYIVIGS